jgi:hypothetical protein
LTATIAITTTGPASAARPYRQAIVPPSHQPPFGWPWLLAGFLVVATLVSLAATGRSRITLLLGVTLLVAGAWAACGGGGGGGGVVCLRRHPQLPCPRRLFPSIRRAWARRASRRPLRFIMAGPRG